MDKNKKTRSAGLAALLSALLPGLGQFYNGDFNKAYYLWISYLLLHGFGLAAAVLFPPIEMVMDFVIILPFLYVFLWLYAVIQAWSSARKKKHYQSPAWQTSGIYLILFISIQVIISPILAQYIRTHYIESFKIPSGSMEPTLYRGDMLFADKRYNCTGCGTAIKRGDPAIFIFPNDRTTFFIKRVIGLPNDRIQIQGKNVTVNGKPLASHRYKNKQGDLFVLEKSQDHTWKTIWKNNKRKLKNIDLIVPTGHIFVLGDNRAASNDSRNFGTVPMSDVVGKAKMIWLSLDYDAKHINWERLGKIIQ